MYLGTVGERDTCDVDLTGNGWWWIDQLVHVLARQANEFYRM